MKEVVNDLIKTYVHKPWRIHSRIITKNELDIVYCNDEKVIRLTAKTWQDNYYHELAERARLDLYTYYMEDKKGDHKYISSQYVPGEEQPDEYTTIERCITYFNEINGYHLKRKKLSMESSDISPGSPRARLDEEFYNRDWTI